MQLSSRFGNCFFHASRNGTASRLATVNSSSKSSPSVSAASKGGLADDPALPARRASRLIGMAVESSSAPTRQAVADVDHCVQGKMLGNPARFFEARLELKMLARQRAAEFTGDKNRVTR